MNSHSLLDHVYALHDNNHGVNIQDIEPMAMPSDASEREQQWEQLWRDLNFHEEPTGSSRLMEVIVAQSTASPHGPQEMLQALFHLLGKEKTQYGTALEFFIKHIWIGCWVYRPRCDCAFDLPSKVLPYPGLTEAQAQLLYRFAALADEQTIQYLEHRLGIH